MINGFDRTLNRCDRRRKGAVRAFFRALAIAVLAARVASGQSALLPSLPEGTKTKIHRVRAGTRDDQGWYHARSTEGQFEVDLPLPFNDFTMTYRKEGRPPLDAFGLGAKSPERMRFSVLKMARNEKMKKPDLKAVVEKLRKDPDYRVSDERILVYQGFPAHEYRVSVDQTGVFTRCIDAPSGLFLLEIEYPADGERLARQLEARFVNSLKFDEKPKPLQHQEGPK